MGHQAVAGHYTVDVHTDSLGWVTCNDTHPIHQINHPSQLGYLFAYEEVVEPEVISYQFYM